MRRLGHRVLALTSVAALLFVFFCVPLTIATVPMDSGGSAPATISTTVILEPTPQDWSTFLQAIGSWSTLNRLGLTALATQGLMLLARSRLSDAVFSAKVKLSIVTGSSLVLGVIALRTGGLDWGQAMMHSTTLAAGQVFGHQLAQTFLPPKTDKES